MLLLSKLEELTYDRKFLYISDFKKKEGKAALAECLLDENIWAVIGDGCFERKIKISGLIRIHVAIWVHHRFPFLLRRFKSLHRRSVGRGQRCAPLLECLHTSSH